MKNFYGEYGILATNPHDFVLCFIIIFFHINKLQWYIINCYILNNQIIKIETDWYIGCVLVKKISRKNNA